MSMVEEGVLEGGWNCFGGAINIGDTHSEHAYILRTDSPESTSAPHKDAAVTL